LCSDVESPILAPPAPRRRSITRIAVPVALGIAALVFVVARFTGNGGEKPQPFQLAVPASVQGNQDWLTPEVRAVATKFALSAGMRHDTGDSWELLDRTYVGKSEFTKGEWAKGDIPVQPATFPFSELDKVLMYVGPSTPRELTLVVYLFPKTGKVEGFDIGLRQRGAGAGKRWLVDYWMTNHKAGFPDKPR
jgi:hypothetical protein